MSLPHAIAWVDARSAGEAAALLQRHGPHARLLAAGGDLFGLMKEGLDLPAGDGSAVLVNLGRATDLHGITRSATGWRLGAMLTLDALAAAPGLPPMLAQAVPRIASPQLRARTTLGGNLLQRPRCLWFRQPGLACFKQGGTQCLAADAPPAAYPGALWPDRCHAGHPSDLAPVLIALAAEVELTGPAGTRRLPLEQLFEGAGQRPGPEAALQPHEVLAALHVPDDHAPQAFEKLAARDANEFAWASVALRLVLDDARVIREATVIVGGIAPGPWRWADADRALRGHVVADGSRAPAGQGGKRPPMDLPLLDLPTAAQAMLPDSPLTRRHLARSAAARTALQQALRQLMPPATG